MSLNVDVQQQDKFNWDDINVGNNQLDHSENFFGQKNWAHERLDGEIEFLEEKMANSDLNNQTENESMQENKENLPRINTIKVESPEMSPSKMASPVDAIKQEHVDDLESNNENSVKTAQVTKKLNLACEWSTQKIKPKHVPLSKSKGAISKTMPPPPQAYLVKDIFLKKRAEAERQRLLEEKKRREFHPRPVPNFSACHEQLEKMKPIHAVTMPVTPQVLKNSKESEEKRRKRLEEWKLKNKPLKFEPRPATILKEKPFIPEKKPSIIKQCPFNLHMEKRLQERKQYDDAKTKALEEKRKQVETEEEERKRREEEHIKELRKAATFKARPNPFKH